MKLVVVEEGSELAAELWGTPEAAASSLLSYPEGRAALGAARRAGRLTARAYREALVEFEATHAELLLLGVDRPLARAAGELAAELALRGYDGVHLASALALGGATTVVTWDAGLARAAIDMGFGVAPAP